ncbi:MAG: nuclear transport factor 2 family protein [Gemmatimonadaceae bacterium]
MKKLPALIVALVLTLLALPAASVAQAPAAKAAAGPDALYQTVSAIDTKLFDAYNSCDLKTLGEMVADDLEFYHDKTGLSVGKPVFLASIKNNICGKVHRTLVPGTLEVYPLKGYGAVEIGVHRFTHPGIDDDFGEAKFTHIWQNKDGMWKLTRVISYDHEPLRK